MSSIAGRSSSDAPGAERPSRARPPKGMKAEALDTILSELATMRARESELLSQLTALVEAPTPDVPAHIARVFALAREAFAEDAAQFLATPHSLLQGEMPVMLARDSEGAQRVEVLLGRIIHGIPV